MIITPEMMMPGFKSKWTNPYDYDPFKLYDKRKTPNGTVYTDRLYQFDSKKHDALCQTIFGNTSHYWDDRPPKMIETFLREWYTDDEIQLTTITEYCNPSTGYPVWRLDFFTPKKV